MQGVIQTCSHGCLSQGAGGWLQLPVQLPELISCPAFSLSRGKRNSNLSPRRGFYQALISFTFFQPSEVGCRVLHHIYQGIFAHLSDPCTIYCSDWAKTQNKNFLIKMIQDLDLLRSIYSFNKPKVWKSTTLEIRGFSPCQVKKLQANQVRSKMAHFSFFSFSPNLPLFRNKIHKMRDRRFFHIDLGTFLITQFIWQGQVIDTGTFSFSKCKSLWWILPYIHIVIYCIPVVILTKNKQTEPILRISQI